MMKYIGKYRAIVCDNQDPKNMGRIRVCCPKVYGDFISNWCTPCIPYLTEGEGMFRLPRVNDAVWIEFEECDPNKPIWIGSWCTPNNTPYILDTPVEGELLIKINNNIVKLSEDQITLTRGKNEIILDNSSITLHGNVNIKGNLTVSDSLKCGKINTDSIHTGSINTGGCNLRKE